jgi:hypothetical protein
VCCVLCCAVQLLLGFSRDVSRLRARYISMQPRGTVSHTVLVTGDTGAAGGGGGVKHGGRKASELWGGAGGGGLSYQVDPFTAKRYSFKTKRSFFLPAKVAYLL